MWMAPRQLLFLWFSFKILSQSGNLQSRPLPGRLRCFDSGIDKAAELGCTLMISLDCGIKSIDKVKYATEKHGIDFIVCDHHEPGDELPEAVAVLDPKRTDCHYPFKELTGNGVGFKLLTAFA